MEKYEKPRMEVIDVQDEVVTGNDDRGSETDAS